MTSALRATRRDVCTPVWNRLRIAAALTLLSSLVLTGCFRPYSKSVFDPPTAEFPGITSHWKSASGGDVRVIFAHGICTHDEPTWITAGWDPVIKDVSEFLGEQASRVSPRPAII
jgi:hypothetical protein